MPRPPRDDQDIFGDMRDEAVDMAKAGFGHPGSRQVLTGAAVGAVAAAILPVVTWPIGLLAGAGFALYTRVKQ